MPPRKQKEIPLTKLDWELLDKDVARFGLSIQIQNNSKAFMHYCAYHLLNIPKEDLDDVVIDGGNDCGVDIFYLTESDEKIVLNLVSCKYKTKFSTSEKNLEAKTVSDAISFITDLVNKSDTLKNCCNPDLFKKVEYFWTVMTHWGLSINYVIASNSKGPASNQMDRGRDAGDRFGFVNISHLGLPQLVNKCVRTVRRSVSRSVALIDDQYFRKNPGANLHGLIGSARASDYIKLITNSDGNIDENIFDDNIRVFLGLNKSVNRDIFESIISDSNKEFWYLNNGVTIVCEEIDYNNVPGAHVFLENFQIVNGGQTSNALFEASKVFPEKLDNVTILLKIYKTTDEDFRTRIATSTNNQSRIGGRDLFANHYIQKKIEDAMLRYEYFYERKKGQHRNKPKEKVIDALRIGQFFLSYFLGFPERAKTQSNEIFGNLYQEIFNDRITPDQVHVCHILGKIIDTEREIVKRSIKSKVADEHRKNEFIVEGYFHVGYVLAKICEQEGIDPSDEYRTQEKISLAIDILRSIATKYQSESYYRFFRSTKAREKIDDHFNNKSDVGDQLDLLT